jgi:hypothetical protein
MKKISKLKREKLYKQMIDLPYDLTEINKDNIFFELDNKIQNLNLRINDLTEFLNIFNSIYSFYVYINLLIYEFY